MAMCRSARKRASKKEEDLRLVSYFAIARKIWHYSQDSSGIGLGGSLSAGIGDVLDSETLKSIQEQVELSTLDLAQAWELEVPVG